MYVYSSACVKNSKLSWILAQRLFQAIKLVFTSIGLGLINPDLLMVGLFVHLNIGSLYSAKLHIAQASLPKLLSWLCHV